MLMQGSGLATLAPLRAALFGSFQLFAPDGSEIIPGGKRSQALLAMLCLQPGVAVDRDQLSQLLWRGKYRAHARASLRQTLLGLKKQLAPVCDDFLEVSRERVAIHAGAVQSDLSELERLLGEGRVDLAIEQLLAIGAKPLLDQFDLGEPFRQWVDGQRDLIEHRLRQAVDRALAQCRRCGDSLAEDRLRAAWRLRDASAALPDTDQRVRIAVLPFHAPSDDDGLGHVVQGLFDELVTT
jgi:DNA-binding SARP family transcriptional activator